MRRCKISTAELKLNGTTIISESGGTATLQNTTLDSTVQSSVIGFSGQLDTDITSTGYWTFSAINKFDPDSIENNGTISIPKTGIYLITLNVQVDNPGSQPAGEYIANEVQVDGTAVLSTGALGYYSASTSSRDSAGCSMIISLTTSNTISVRSYHSSTGGTTYGGNTSRFSLLYLGQ